MKPRQNEFGMTVKRRRPANLRCKALSSQRECISPAKNQRRVGSNGSHQLESLRREPPEDVGGDFGGMAEAQAYFTGPCPRQIRGGRDKVKDKTINTAYRKSKILKRLDRSTRRRWSIVKEEKLAAVFGTYVRGEDVFNIDLAAIVNVDEWLECEAELNEAIRQNDQVQIEQLESEIAWIESQMYSYPAHSIFGIICKLMVWRRKNKDLLAAPMEEGDAHRLAHAAYADLIRLTGFFSVATVEDREAGLL